MPEALADAPVCHARGLTLGVLSIAPSPALASPASLPLAAACSFGGDGDETQQRPIVAADGVWQADV
jgi:hypothetical protein